MNNSLDPVYVKWIDKGGNIKELTQDMIDRIQYSKGFLASLFELIDEHYTPMEVVNGTRILKHTKI